MNVGHGLVKLMSFEGASSNCIIAEASTQRMIASENMSATGFFILTYWHEGISQLVYRQRGESNVQTVN
jgi:hypothetical protein